MIKTVEQIQRDFVSAACDLMRTQNEDIEVLNAEIMRLEAENSHLRERLGELIGGIGDDM
ncbi:MAG: hypothetical protein ACOYJ9_01420 [Candidatus Metalachnospira sp.]|jgi:hypothetical protein